MTITKSLKSEKNKKAVDASTKKCYDTTQSYIYSAIQELGKIAPNDNNAKDAIANLSVVLFDLKSIS